MSRGTCVYDKRTKEDECRILEQFCLHIRSQMCFECVKDRRGASPLQCVQRLVGSWNYMQGMHQTFSTYLHRREFPPNLFRRRSRKSLRNIKNSDAMFKSRYHSLQHELPPTRTTVEKCTLAPCKTPVALMWACSPKLLTYPQV